MLLSKALESNTVTLGQRVSLVNGDKDTASGTVSKIDACGVRLSQATSSYFAVDMGEDSSFWVCSEQWEVVDVAI